MEKVREIYQELGFDVEPVIARIKDETLIMDMLKAVAKDYILNDLKEYYENSLQKEILMTLVSMRGLSQDLNFPSVTEMCDHLTEIVEIDEKGKFKKFFGFVKKDDVIYSNDFKALFDEYARIRTILRKHILGV